MQKKRTGCKTISAFVLILPLLFCLTNCSVLTSSQIQEVQKFAQVSSNYTALPGALPESYGLLLRNNKLLKISRETYGNADKDGRIDPAKAKQAWQDIQKAYKLETELNAAGKKLNGALSVLAAYSKILSTLVSDDHSNTLGQRAETLGEELDAATEEYNSRFRKNHPLDKVGSPIAKAIRGAGGIYLRIKQAAILRETIAAANPVIGAIMKDIEHIAFELFKPTFENYEKNYLGQVFQSVAVNRRKLSVETLAFVYDDLVRTRSAISLSEQIATAARTYGKAHQRLVESTRSRADLKTIIEEIEILKNEIDAAKKIEAKVTG